MSRIQKLDIDAWDPELRNMTRADSATPLEQGLMRMLAHVPDIAKGFRLSADRSRFIATCRIGW